MQELSPLYFKVIPFILIVSYSGSSKLENDGTVFPKRVNFSDMSKNEIHKATKRTRKVPHACALMSSLNDCNICLLVDNVHATEVHFSSITFEGLLCSSITFEELLCGHSRVRLTTIRELKQPRRQRKRKSHKFAYLTMKNSIFARFARAFFIF